MRMIGLVGMILAVLCIGIGIGGVVMERQMEARIERELDRMEAEEAQETRSMVAQARPEPPGIRWVEAAEYDRIMASRRAR